MSCTSSFHARVISLKSLTFTFTCSFQTFFFFPFPLHLLKPESHHQSLPYPSFFRIIQNSIWNFIQFFFISWKHCCSMSGMRLKQNTMLRNIAWFPFYRQEHKSHNNVSLVMEHLFAQAVAESRHNLFVLTEILSCKCKFEDWGVGQWGKVNFCTFYTRSINMYIILYPVFHFS